MCVVGVSSSPYHRPVDMNRIGASIVLANSVIFGTVSAARRHYELAVEALAGADQAWLSRLIGSASRYPAGRRGLPGSQVSKGRVDLTR